MAVRKPTAKALPLSTYTIRLKAPMASTTDTVPTSADERSADVFDLTLALLQCWKLLLGTSLVCALLAFGWGKYAPQWYESTTVIDPLPPHPVDGLDYGTLEARREFAKLVPEWLNSRAANTAATQVARRAGTFLSPDGIRLKTGRQDGLITLTVKAGQPEASQKISHALLEAAFEVSRPTGPESARLARELARYEEQLKALNRALDELRLRLAKASDNKFPENAASLTRLTNTLRLTERQRQATEALFRGLTRDYIKQGPTLPSKPSNMRPHVRAVWAFLGGLFGMATMLAMRWTFAGAGPSPEQRARFRSIFGSRPSARP
jgi:hypothetical protein